MTIQLITFDLDNTLWDVQRVIGNAERAMRGWLQAHVPEVVAFYENDGVGAVREALLTAQPELRHDLSKLRVEVVTRSIQEVGRSDEDARLLAAQAFEVFYEGRHQVEYYEHALDTLALLSDSYTLAALTNGNADIDKLGLDRYFAFGYTAAQVGASKPAPDMFHAALEKAEVDAHRAVHVGDHPEDDIAGASNVGMHTIWVDMHGLEVGSVTPSTVIRSLDELPRAVRGLSA